MSAGTPKVNSGDSTCTLEGNGRLFMGRHVKDDKKKTFQTLSLITQLGLMMIASLGMTTALGIWLDRKLGTSFLTVIFFFLGAVAGVQGIYRMIRQIYGDEGHNKGRSTSDENDGKAEGGR